jgi:3-oxoacyl-[acyl-carrier protein] reductase
MLETREPTSLKNSSFEDINVGDSASLTHAISQDDLNAFVRLTGDDNPLHVDESFSRKTLFRRPVVHGMLSASFISTIIGTRLPGGGALWISQTLDFLRPAFVGDTITVTARVEQKSVATRVLALTTRVVNQHGHELIRGRSQVKLLDVGDAKREPSVDQTSRVILVTGSSRGIGAAIVDSLAGAGHRVAVNYHRSSTEADSLVDRLVGQGYAACAVRADVSDARSVQDMFAQIEKTFGPVEDIIHCAAPLPVPTSFEDLTWEQFQLHLDTQLRGAFHCAKAALPGMVLRRNGSLIFIGSVFADGVPPPQQSAYVVAKAALTSFARTLAVEYGPKGIRVNVIAPGMTRTDMIAKIPEKTKMLAKMQTPLRQLAEPGDIAAIAEFLIGPGARHITGETIRVSGGISMG